MARSVISECMVITRLPLKMTKTDFKADCTTL